MNYFIYDIDGTLYDFDKGERNSEGKTKSYDESDFKKDLFQNVRSFFISKLNYSEEAVDALFRKMDAEGDKKFSVFVQKNHGVSRGDYFNYVWDLDPSKYVSPNENLNRIFDTTKNNLIISNAPRIWASRVLEVLGIEEYFSSGNLFTGELEICKPKPEIFEMAVEYFKTEPTKCYSIGDQEDTDLLPANKLKMKTIMVRNKSKDHTPTHEIDSINELLERLF